MSVFVVCVSRDDAYDINKLTQQIYVNIDTNNFLAVDNLALDKPAYQSSTLYNKGATLATDGSRESLFEAGSCTHTKKENKPWWVVDLQNQYYVDVVVLTNRGDDCCCK